MLTQDDLMAAVDAAFRTTGRSCAPWPDPHPDRRPHEEEYSRVTDPAKWRIIGARADAWLHAVVELGLAEVQRGVVPRWAEPPRTVVTRADVAVPRRTGALGLLLTRNQIEDVDDAGVTIGVGDPATVAWSIPDCGCDACDSGSQDVLDELDEWVGGIVRGEFRRLTRRVERPPRPAGFFWTTAPPDDDEPFAPGSVPVPADTWALPEQEEITVISSGRWSASGSFARGEVEAALAHPNGWHEVTGVAWGAD